MNEQNRLGNTLAVALSGVIELAVNTALKYDPATRQKLAGMNDILALDITQPPLTLYFCGSSDGINVMHHCETHVSTTISGSLLALLKLLQNPNALTQSDVNVAGKIGVLQQWQAIFGDIDIDWEDALASILGDFTPYAASAIKNTVRYTQQQQRELSRLGQEYFIEELRVVPGEDELEYFYSQVRDVGLAVDRIGARIERLQQTIKSKG